jgi:hypothetical protein
MIKHVKNHVVGYLALFLVLAGSAYASHLTVFSSDIVDGEVRSVDVQDNGLTGTDIAESTLSVHGMGCQPGKISGYARIKDNASGTHIPSSYTYNGAWIDKATNCSGGVVQVRRQQTGVYYVWFSGNPSQLALATSNADNYGLESTHNDNFVTVSRQFTGPDAGAFRVEVQDAGGSNGSDPQDGQFTLAVL